jgi:probable HAF family extracellular repeat protein
VLWRQGVPLDLGQHVAEGVNDRGQAIGFLDLATLTGFLWDDGVRTELTRGADSRAIAINKRGQVVGGIALLPPGSEPNPFHAYVFHDGSLVDLGTLPGHFESSAHDINDHGQIVGVSTSEPVQGQTSARAVLWQDGDIIDLGTLGGDFSEATAINKRGQVIGRSTTEAGHERAFVWQDGTMTPLGTLGGNTSTATAINRWGQIIGTSTTADGPTHGFLWRDGLMIDLGTFIPRKINNRGQLIGDVGGRQLFFWQHGVLTDLSPDTPSGVAADINDWGVIAGSVGDTPVIWVPRHRHRSHDRDRDSPKRKRHHRGDDLHGRYHHDHGDDVDHHDGRDWHPRQRR